jgi:signal transduction histidine kinase
MNVAYYIPLAGCLCNVFFALFVFYQAPRAVANRVYLLLGLAIATWNLGSYKLFVVDNAADALFWARIIFVGVIFVTAGFVHLSVIVGNCKPGNWLGYLYLFDFGLVILDWSPWFIKRVQPLGSSGWYSVAGPAFHLLNIPCHVCLIAVFVLWRKRRNLPPTQRLRLTSLIVAQATLYFLGMNDLLPIIGILKYPFTDTYVYPYGSLAAVFYGIIVSYSVLHHQLLDVHVTLSKYAAHFIRFAFLFFTAMALLFFASLAASDAFNPRSFALALGVFFISSLLTAALFPRLFGAAGFEKWERRILGDRFEYQDQVRNFITDMTWCNDLERLLDDLDQVLTQTFCFSSYQIILREETTRAFRLFRSFPEEPQRQLPELKSQSAVFQYFESGHGEYLALRETSLRAAGSRLERQAREELLGFGSELGFALTCQNEPYGLLLIGPKTKGEPITATDINLLVTVVKSMGLMINQIRLTTQVIQNQELDLLGRMSRGMAHDLNNLLTPVSTLLQLREETGVFDDELLPVAARNVSTMRAYIRDALFFSENLRPDIQLAELDSLVRRAIDVARNAREKQVDIVSTLPTKTIAEVDSVQIERLISNLITNAIDASPEGGEVHIVLERLAKTDEHRDWLRLRVIDHGEGISRENLNRVLSAYFSTKNRGDENRGFGLGLAICRKIAALHGGKLTIESQLRKGATVQLDLPAHQIRPASASSITNASSQAA